jgi:hypothetical protein
MADETRYQRADRIAREILEQLGLTRVTSSDADDGLHGDHLLVS